MIYIVYIPEEAAMRIECGKKVTGIIAKDSVTGDTSFQAFKESKGKGKKDQMICPLTTGWLKGSKLKFKLFLSVNREIGAYNTKVVMTNELKKAMAELIVKETLGKLND